MGQKPVVAADVITMAGSPIREGFASKILVWSAQPLLPKMLQGNGVTVVCGGSAARGYERLSHCLFRELSKIISQ